MAKGTGEQFHFKIDGYTPDSLPMARLAVYMAELAVLLGSEDRVHFVKVAKGSADLVHVVEEPQVVEVKHRIHLVKQGLGPQEAQAAFRKLNATLAEDHKTAKMMQGRGQLLIFAGAKVLPAAYGPVTMQGHLDGVVIRVGGKDGTKPVHIMNPDAYYICNANAEVARKLIHAYEKEIRVYGTGKWFRQGDGRWKLDGFNINDFEVLNSAPLTDVLDAMRAIPGNSWLEVEDPLKDLADIRGFGVPN
jgi:hypothetical protein